MEFFSGFSLRNDRAFFEEFLLDSDYSVAGFSYGAIKAFEYLLANLGKRRIDRVQLFSPAFFQNHDAKFKRLQLMGYRRDEKQYLESFVQSCFAPHAKKNLSHMPTTIEMLEELLEYEWCEESLDRVVKRGVAIEVYLGSEDRIIDVKRTKEFFLPYATVTTIKGANHLLQIK